MARYWPFSRILKKNHSKIPVCVARLQLQWIAEATAPGPLRARSCYRYRFHLRHKLRTLFDLRRSGRLYVCISRHGIRVSGCRVQVHGRIRGSLRVLQAHVSHYAWLLYCARRCLVLSQMIELVYGGPDRILGFALPIHCWIGLEARSALRSRKERLAVGRRVQLVVFMFSGRRRTAGGP